jgi:hypothetical protein
MTQFGRDVAQSGAGWPSRAQFGSVKKGVSLLEGRFEFNFWLDNSRRSTEPNSQVEMDRGLSEWHQMSVLKVPKREIFVTELFTRSDPIWIGDMRTEPIKPFV